MAPENVSAAEKNLQSKRGSTGPADVNLIEKRHRHHEGEFGESSNTKFHLQYFEECKFPQLNDDCLLAIFARLSIVDMFGLKKCCRRFNELVDMAMPTRCSKETFRCIWKHGTHENILESYGEFMQNVILERITDESSTGEPYCDPPTWFRKCRSLKTLTIRKVPLVYDQFSAQVYAGLESLTIEDCPGDEENYKLIIAACKNLKSILVLNGKFRFDWIGKLVNLESISTRTVGVYSFLILRFANELKRLKKLKYLYLDLSCYEFFVALVLQLPGSLPIEHFVLCIRKGVETCHFFADALEKMKAMKLCQIRYYREQDDAIGKSNAQALTRSITEFHVSMGYYYSPLTPVDNYYDIKLQRKT